MKTPDQIGTTLPIIVSNMTAVASKRMAETTARRGALTVIPQDTPADVLVGIIKYIKSCHLVFETPITLSATSTVNDASGLLPKRAHGAVIIVEKDKPIGIVTESMMAGLDPFAQLSEIMQRKIVTVLDTTEPQKVFQQLHDEHITFAPAISAKGKLVGCITKKDALRSTIYTPALDKKGRFMVAVAIGINGDIESKAKLLIDNEVDVIVVDTAHGHQQKMIDAVKTVRRVTPNHKIIAGNVATAAATEALIGAGADIVKVGIGPGAMCTTRIMTGVGRPQFSAVTECAIAARKTW